MARKEERRSCSKLKPWIYFSMEMTIFMMAGYIIMRLVGEPYGQGVGVLFVIGMTYKTRAVQRLERVLERTEEVRRVKIIAKYGLDS